MIVSGTYGTNNPCDVLVLDDGRNGHWYCVRGSCTVNHCTDQHFEDGINVEMIEDDDTFTWPETIDTLNELAIAVDD